MRAFVAGSVAVSLAGANCTGLCRPARASCRPAWPAGAKPAACLRRAVARGRPVGSRPNTTRRDRRRDRTAEPSPPCRPCHRGTRRKPAGRHPASPCAPRRGRRSARRRLDWSLSSTCVADGPPVSQRWKYRPPAMPSLTNPRNSTGVAAPATPLPSNAAHTRATALESFMSPIGSEARVAGRRGRVEEVEVLVRQRLQVELRISRLEAQVLAQGGVDVTRPDNLACHRIDPRPRPH